MGTEFEYFWQVRRYSDSFRTISLNWAFALWVFQGYCFLNVLLTLVPMCLQWHYQLSGELLVGQSMLQLPQLYHIAAKN